MKRIEAIIASEKVLPVNEALKNAGVGGCTVLDAKGRGKVENVVNTILDVASTGAAGDGKIFISTVIDAIDIGSKERGGGNVIK